MIIADQQHDAVNDLLDSLKVPNVRFAFRENGRKNGLYKNLQTYLQIF